MGPLLCLISAACFGAMAIFGKLSYDEGVTVGDLLLVRFALAASALLAVVGATGALRGLPRRSVLAALGMGAIGYATQSGLFFLALERMDASLLALVLYTYPALVFAAAVLIRRERADARRVAALALALGGLALVVAGAGAGALDPLGAALALGAALVYSTYILVRVGVVGRVRPLVLSALVCTGASLSLAIGSSLLGELRPGELTAAGWGWLGCIAVVSTVAAVSLFFAGLQRAGPTTASILATVEPVVTVLLAFLVFSERLGPVQLAGGALVVAAVLVLNVRRPRTAPAAVPAPARTLA